MNVQTIASNDTNNYERILVNIVRTLPPSRAEQLVDFARFLEAEEEEDKSIRSTK